MAFKAAMIFIDHAVGGGGVSRTPPPFIVLSADYGAQNIVTVGTGGRGAGSGKVAFKSLTITKVVDLASPIFFAACAAGSHFATAYLNITPEAPATTPFSRYVFRLVYVEDITYSSSLGDNQEMETIKFVFGAMGIAVGDTNGQLVPQNSSTWSQVTNQNTLSTGGSDNPPNFP